jgi:hypothetical protein
MTSPEIIASIFYERIPAETCKKWDNGLLTVQEATTEAARAYILDSLTGYERKRLHDAARRIIDLDSYEARHEDETPESITAALIKDPASVVIYLLDILEELQQ